MLKNSKKTPKYSCDVCHFNTSNKQDYNRHISTLKHKNKERGDEKETEKTPKNSNAFECGCGKQYAVYGSLWRHKKNCSQKPIEKEEVANPNSQFITMDVVMEIMRKNTEVQNMLIEQNNKLMEKITELSKPQNNTVSNSHNNNNNSFNLNFFLNEQCKDAVNLVDFIDNLKVTVKDLERTGQLGYVEGISQIFIEGLKELDVNKRPIHCTDLKRETVYVKDQDKWEKENEEKTRLKTAIKKIAKKNLQQLPVWQVENPECSNSSSQLSDQFIVISQNSLGGFNDKDESKYQNTIIKNVLKTAKLPTDESVVKANPRPEG